MIQYKTEAIPVEIWSDMDLFGRSLKDQIPSSFQDVSTVNYMSCIDR